MTDDKLSFEARIKSLVSPYSKHWGAVSMYKQCKQEGFDDAINMAIKEARQADTIIAVQKKIITELEEYSYRAYQAGYQDCHKTNYCE